MEEQYFVITPGEGEASIDAIDRFELEQRLRKHEDGDCYYGSDLVFKKTVLGQGDIAYWGDRDILIIKGKVVVPEPVSVVETYKFI